MNQASNHCPPDYQPRPELLANTTIVISGAAGSIGSAVAAAAAAAGATTVLLGRKVPQLEAIYDAIEHAGHPQPALYPIDLEGATPDDYAELAQRLGDEFGHLDGLVHCAAMLHGLTPLENFPPAAWYRTLQVNLNAPFLLTQALLPLLKQAPRAAIVFSSHPEAAKGAPYWGAYAAAQAGQQALLTLLAEELDTNTRVIVNGVDPGPCHTRLRLRVHPSAEPGWTRPADVARAYLYLLGPDSGEITGQTLRAEPAVSA